MSVSTVRGGGGGVEGPEKNRTPIPPGYKARAPWKSKGKSGQAFPGGAPARPPCWAGARSRAPSLGQHRWAGEQRRGERAELPAGGPASSLPPLPGRSWRADRAFPVTSSSDRGGSASLQRTRGPPFALAPAAPACPSPPPAQTRLSPQRPIHPACRSPDPDTFDGCPCAVWAGWTNEGKWVSQLTSRKLATLLRMIFQQLFWGGGAGGFSGVDDQGLMLSSGL